jgi:hypothetical protein
MHIPAGQSTGCLLAPISVGLAHVAKLDFYMVSLECGTALDPNENS